MGDRNPAELIYLIALATIFNNQIFRKRNNDKDFNVGSIY